MLFEEALTLFISAHPTLGPVFGERVYPLRSAKLELRPAIVYRMDDRALDQIIVGKTGKEDRRYSLVVWGDQYLQAKRCAELVVLAFNQIKQPIGPFPDVVCFMKTQRDVEFADQAELYGVEMDIQCLFLHYPPES